MLRIIWYLIQTWFSIQLYCKCGLRFALAQSIALETDETCKQKCLRPIVIISDILCTKVKKKCKHISAVGWQWLGKQQSSVLSMPGHLLYLEMAFYFQAFLKVASHLWASKTAGHRISAAWSFPLTPLSLQCCLCYAALALTLVGLASSSQVRSDRPTWQKRLLACFVGRRPGLQSRLRYRNF